MKLILRDDHNLVYFLTQRLICRQILMERRQYLPTQSASDHRGVKTNGFPRGVGEKTKKNTNGWLSCFVGLSIRTNCMPADNGLSLCNGYNLLQVKTNACLSQTKEKVRMLHYVIRMLYR